jgi:hypothetical protein
MKAPPPAYFVGFSFAAYWVETGKLDVDGPELFDYMEELLQALAQRMLEVMASACNSYCITPMDMPRCAYELVDYTGRILQNHGKTHNEIRRAFDCFLHEMESVVRADYKIQIFYHKKKIQ